MGGTSTQRACGHPQSLRLALAVLIACTAGCTGAIGGGNDREPPHLLGPADGPESQGTEDGAVPPPGSPDGGVPQVIPDAGMDVDATPGTEPDPDPIPDPDPTPDPDPDPPPPTPDPVPLTAHCMPVAYWGAAATAVEDQVLAQVNQYRASGAMCGSEYMPPVPALTMNPALRCAARLHSADMDARNFFDHTNPDNVKFSARITDAGYSWGWAGENIVAPGAAIGAAGMMNAWMNSPGHCLNIMSPYAKDIGVGATQGHGTQDFGAPL